MKNLDPDRLLTKIRRGYTPDKKEICFLLGLEESSDLEKLFQVARETRSRYFENKIFLYGFLYFSTYCRNDCNFCQYRKSNTSLARYRKTKDEILAAARQMADTGVHLIDLTMGEDSQLYTTGFKLLPELVREVKRTTGLPVMISPGVVPDSVIDALAAVKTDWYACYQETHNRDHYAGLRKNQNFNERINAKKAARSRGMLIEEGILTGVDENREDLTDSILWMKNFGVDQARVMTFVPQTGTPMAHVTARSNLKERIIIAVMRLVLKDCLIPASLDVDGLEGLKARLDAGANVVTSIVPPETGLAGVANRSLDIEESRRSTDHVSKILSSCGLEPAGREEYPAWIEQRKTNRAAAKLSA